MWLYHRFVSYDTIHQWCREFGRTYANGLRRRRPRPGERWHLDEMFIKIGGKTLYLWRAVDQHGNVLGLAPGPAGTISMRSCRRLVTGSTPA